ncbi:MAG: class I SAM-dependent methyltransferase [Pseudomonadota bacterium]
MRDFRTALTSTRCWDRHTQALYEAHGEATEDCILQSREELIALCEVMERLGVRSYLEIGAWTGALTRTLQGLFQFEKLAVCDDGWAERKGLAIHLPPEARFFQGDSASPEFSHWRAGLGHFDLVMIDANHAYRAVRRDFELQRTFPHGLLVFHDITGANRHTAGVRRFWRELREGWKHEILRPHLALGLDHSIMGLGLWAAAPPPGWDGS